MSGSFSLFLGLLVGHTMAETGAIGVQGAISNDAGAPLEGNHALTLSLWGAASGGSPIYEETVTASLSRGAFSHAFGSAGALDLGVFADDAWISVAVDGGPASDRVPVGWAARAAFAARADTLDGLDSAAFRRTNTTIPWIDVAAPTDVANRNADTLDTLDSTAFRRASVLVPWADVAVPADVGNRNADTLDSLDSAAFRRAGVLVPWAEVAVPSDIADGDAVGVYTNGAGLTLTGSVFDLNTAAVRAEALTVAQAKNAIYFPASFANVAALPAASANAGGVAYVAGTTKRLYLSDGTSWVPVGSGGAAPTFSNRQSFTYTGAEQVWTVPNGVTQVRISAWGGGGAGKEGQDHTYNYTSNGGGGGFVAGTIDVTAGESLTIVVGRGGQAANGTGGWSTISTGGNGGMVVTGVNQTGREGGGGGGASGVRRGSTKLLVAGAGGGGGNAGGGGGGGGDVGRSVQTQYPTNGCPSGPHFGGAGGTQIAGGIGGVCSDCDGTTRGGSGSATLGGFGQSQGNGAPTGGGGGGWFAGGGGGGDSTGGGCNIHDTGAGGGGGFSYYLPGTTSVETLSGGDGSSTANNAGGIAPRTDHPGYQAGVAVGGAVASPGGNGLVVIEY